MASRLHRMERLMGMTDAVWARHANPWSGWTRVLTLPLFALAVWSRVWIGWWAVLPVGLLLVWTWVNPRLFPPPRSTRNWMSQGVLGERIWLARRGDAGLAHHVPVVRALIDLAAAGTAVLAFGLAILSLPLTLLGLAVAMLSKLWFVDRMVWIASEADRG